MEIQKVRAICYSATGNTARTVTTVAEELAKLCAALEEKRKECVK